MRGALRSPRAAVAALVFVGYLVVARAVGNLYPFSTYSMYAESGTGRPSRLVARETHGSMVDLDRYDHWACPDLPPLDRASCPSDTPSSSIPYVDREADHYVRSHAGTGHEPGARAVDLVRHVWWFVDENGAPREFDCPVRHCRAVPR